MNPRWSGPRTYLQGVAFTATCPLRSGGQAVIPTSGTLTIYRPDGTEFLSADAGTVTNGVLAYSFLSTAFDLETPGPKWVELWAVVSGGVTYLFRRSAVLGVFALHSVVCVEDLLELHPELASLVPDTQVSWQPQLDAALAQVLTKLERLRLPASRIVGPEVLRSVLLFQTALIVARLLDGGSGQSRWAGLSEVYATLLAEEWAGMFADVDEDDDNVADSTGDSEVRMSPTLSPTGDAGIGTRAW